jgi:hypothetical protein
VELNIHFTLGSVQGEYFCDSDCVEAALSSCDACSHLSAIGVSQRKNSIELLRQSHD